MEHLPDGAHLRLRNRVHSTYLSADEDGVGVSLRPHGAVFSVNAVWMLQRVEFEGSPLVALQSAAYGRYLATSFDEAPPGHRGRRAIQRDYAGPFINNLMWRAIPVGGGYIRMRHELNHNLRANGRHRIWNTGVTVDSNLGIPTTMMHWKLEVIPQTAVPPPLPPPAQNQGGRGLFWWRKKPEEDTARTIEHVRADDEGNFTQIPDNWDSFDFYGRSISNLRTALGVLEPDANINGITMCVRPGFHGRLTPLITDLPRNEDTMYIVVLTAGSPGTETLRYPNI